MPTRASVGKGVVRYRSGAARVGNETGVVGLSRTLHHGRNPWPGVWVCTSGVAALCKGRRRKGHRQRGCAAEGEAVETCEENLFGMYCNIDPAGRYQALSLGEKEHLFLEALVYAGAGEPALTDAEYDALKEDLEWQGSLLATLSHEQRGLFVAAKAYWSGVELMSDGEYDQLRRQMRIDGVAFALPGHVVHGPRCSIRSRRVYTDAGEDISDSIRLKLPSLLLISLGCVSLAVASGAELPFGWVGCLTSLLVAYPIVSSLSKKLTSSAMGFSAMFTAQCPQCGRQLDVAHSQPAKTDKLSCPHCQASLEYNNQSHQLTLI